MNMKTLTETSTFRVLSLLLCFCFFIPAMNVSPKHIQATDRTRTARSEERRVGKECRIGCRSRWSPYH